MRGMTNTEKRLKAALKRTALKDSPYFADFLDQFKVFITHDPEIPLAAVSTQHGIIFLNPNIMAADPGGDLLITSIRHELAHVILKHKAIGIKWLAPYFDINPHHMTKKQREFLLRQLYRKYCIPTLTYDENGNIKYGKISVLNAAGDWHLSREIYNEKDIEVSKKIGGLILELDHPEMMDMSYMEILEEIQGWVTKYRREATQLVRGRLKDDNKTFEREVDDEI